MMKTKFNLTSISFIALISAYFTFMLNIKFWQFAFEKIEITSFPVVIFILTLPIFIYVPLFWFFSLIVLPRVGKPLIILLLVCSAISDYALQNLGVVFNADMIRNIVETNTREAMDLISLHAIFYTLIVGVIPAVIVGKTNIKFSVWSKELKQRLVCFLLGIMAVGICAALSYKEYASFGRNNKEVRYYINTFNYIYAIGRYHKLSNDAKRKFVILDEAPQLEKTLNGKPRVTVLIVGETARAQNFSLYGYDKETNPRLAQNKEIIAFNEVKSCGTATAISLPCMFSPFTAKDFNVTDAKYTQNILDLAKNAGYHVIWLDNDDGCKNVCKRFNMIDAKKDNKEPYCFGNYCHDDILLDGLTAFLKDIKKDTLIVLHTMGSHGPTYYKRYPEKFRHFTPTCDTANLQDCTKNEIVNTYNNTIVYTDYIISSAIDILKQYPELQSNMLYVSDHGESLGENNIYLHGLPYLIAPDYQKKVPMILWLNQDTEKEMKVDEKCLREYAKTGDFSHDNIFHSVLKLLGVKTKAYDENLDIFAKCLKRGGR